MHKLICLLLAAVFVAPLAAHADTMGYEFTLFHYIVGGPDNPPGTPVDTAKVTFDLSIWQRPTFVTPPEDVVGKPSIFYGDISFPGGTSDGGIDVKGVSGVPGGEVYVSGGLTVGANGALTYFWTGDPYDPTFHPGHYPSFTQIGDYFDVAPIPAPELSTFGLLGTGLVGLAGILRRRLTR
jgi:hypothetical protein